MVSRSCCALLGLSLRVGLSFLPQKLALGHANQQPRRLPRIDSGRIRANRFESRTARRKLIRGVSKVPPVPRRAPAVPALPQVPQQSTGASFSSPFFFPQEPPSPAHSPTRAHPPTPSCCMLDAAASSSRFVALPVCGCVCVQKCACASAAVLGACGVRRVCGFPHINCGCALFFGHAQCRGPHACCVSRSRLSRWHYVTLRLDALLVTALLQQMLSRLQPAHRIGVAGGSAYWCRRISSPLPSQQGSVGPTEPRMPLRLAPPWPPLTPRLLARGTFPPRAYAAC